MIDSRKYHTLEDAGGVERLERSRVVDVDGGFDLGLERVELERLVARDHVLGLVAHAALVAGQVAVTRELDVALRANAAMLARVGVTPGTTDGGFLVLQIAYCIACKRCVSAEGGIDVLLTSQN